MSVFNVTLFRNIPFLKRLSRLLAAVSLLVVTVVVLFWATVHVWIVPRIDGWRGDLEAMASEALGVTVEVGALEAQDRAWWQTPVWVLRDVRILNPEGTPALQLGRVQAAASLSSLLWRQGFDQLVVDAAHVHVRRSVDDRWWVAGLDVTPKGPSDGKGLRWVLAQSEWALRDGQVTWTDELHQRPPVNFADVDLVIRRQGRQHTASLGLTPPASWGDRWTLQADMRDSAWTSAPPAQPWAQWTGTVQWDVPRLEAAPWAAQAAVWPGVPTAVQQLAGHGAIQVKAQLEDGRPSEVTVKLDWPSLSTQAQAKAPRVALLDVKGLLRADWTDGVGVAVEGLQARTASGLRVKAEQLAWRKMDHADRRESTQTLEARGVDARDVTALAKLWPLPPALMTSLSRWEPAAQIDEMSARWTLQTDDAGRAVWANRYQAQGRVRDVQAIDRGAPGSPALPGLRGLAVNFAVDQNGGQAQLDMAQGGLSLPGILDDAWVPIEGLEGALTWRIDGPAIEAEVRGLRLATPDWHGEVQAQWRTAQAEQAQDRWPGVLDLNVQLRDVNVARVHRYFPSVVSPGVRRYIREGFVAGTAPKVSIQVKGDLRDLPLGRSDAKGQFLVEADLDQVDFAYMPPYLHAATDPPWPRLQQAKTALRFDGLSLQVGPIQADLQGAPGVRVTEGQVKIVDLAQGPAQLSVALNTQGPSPSFLQFVNGSPLKRMTGGALAQAQAQGDVSGAFALQMRFADDPQLRLQGHAAMKAMDLRWAPGTPMAQDIQGRIDFNEAGFTVAPTQARLLGEVFRVQGGTVVVPPGQASRLSFDVQGRLSAEGLRRAELGAVSRLAESMTGSTALSLRLGVRGGVPEVDLQSDLVGLGLNLPAPMAKPPALALPLKVQSAVDSVQGTRVTGDRWRVSLGDGASQRVGVDVRRDLRSIPAVLSGHAWVGQAPVPAARLADLGWSVDVQLPRLDVDAWLAALAPATRPASTPVAQPTGSSPQSALLPRSVRLAVDELRVTRRDLHDVRLLALNQSPRWRLDVSAKEAVGWVDLEPNPMGGLSQVRARLSRLTVPDATQADVESFIEQPTMVPALDVVIDDLRVGAIALGRVEVDATNHGEGDQQSWRLNRFRMTLPEASLSANGVWATATSPLTEKLNKSTALQFQMDIRDAGALLQRVGQSGNLNDGQGQVSGSVAWAGSPITPDLASLSGQWQLRLEKGQILKIDPGAGRLVGVLSLQSLPRRFLLDFRDAFVDGFAFDDFSGQVDLAQGVATSRNLRLRSILADVHMDGEVDLVKRTQDIQLLIVPEINVGTASLALVTVNPVLGWSTFLAQLLLRTPLKAMVSQQMHVTGTWAQPQVNKIAPTPSPKP